MEGGAVGNKANNREAEPHPETGTAMRMGAAFDTGDCDGQRQWILRGMLGMSVIFTADRLRRTTAVDTAGDAWNVGDIDGRQVSRLPWMLGTARLTKVATVVEAGQQQRLRRIFAAMDSNDITTINDNHCQGRWQW